MIQITPDFIDHNMDMVLTFLSVAGLVETAVLVGVAIYATFLWARGVLPAILRLGNGLAKRKIAIFAKSDTISSLKSLMVDSKLFTEKNIIEIATSGDIGRAECATVYLIFWPDWSDDIAKILSMKPDKCALIVYAPYAEGRISNEQMAMLDGKRHTTVVNFRGRLLNDIVVSMITTSYEK